MIAFAISYTLLVHNGGLPCLCDLDHPSYGSPIVDYAKYVPDLTILVHLVKSLK